MTLPQCILGHLVAALASYQLLIAVNVEVQEVANVEVQGVANVDIQEVANVGI